MIKTKDKIKMIRKYIIDHTPDIDSGYILQKAAIEKVDVTAPKTQTIKRKYILQMSLSIILIGILGIFIFFFLNQNKPTTLIPEEKLYAVSAVNLVIIDNWNKNEYLNTEDLMVVDEIDNLNYYLGFMEMMLSERDFNFESANSDLAEYANLMTLIYNQKQFSAYYNEIKDNTEILVVYDGKNYHISADNNNSENLNLTFTLIQENHEYQLKITEVNNLVKKQFEFVFKKNNTVYHRSNLVIHYNDEISATLHNISQNDKDISFIIQKGRHLSLYDISYQIKLKEKQMNDKPIILAIENGKIDVQTGWAYDYQYTINTDNVEIFIDSDKTIR